MNNGRRFSITVALTGTLALAACSSPGGSPNGARSAASPAQAHHVSVHASWADAYGTVQEMAQNAGAVALVTITSVEGHDVAEKLPYTTFRAQVNRWISTSGSTPASILIRQLGGTSQGVTYSADDDPMLRVGEKDLVFVREYSPGRYVIVGGPAGRLQQVGNDLRGLSGVPSPHGVPGPSTSVIASIRDAITSGPAKSRVVS